ncbi:protein MOS2-like [Canna indica]|uniref:Protein MOS2-like n=1 Tax=Canna indica TaxID=4628 RepID=A0AAQ3KPE8_9LILI|nr:protein MOS2-like [Canna indica]
MEKEPTKVSFSFSSKPSSRLAAPKPPHPPAEDDNAKPQFVTAFDPSAAPNPSDAKPVIPPIPNVEYNPALKRMKNLIPLPNSDDDPSAVAAENTHFVLDTSTGDDAAGHISYGLTLRSADGPKSEREELGDPGRGRSRAENDELMQRRFREDLKDLPEDRGMEEFNDIKVEDFAAAMLAGYGWTQGQVIGRNKKLADTKVFEHKRMAGSEGLGYNPSEGDPKKKRGNWTKEEKIVTIISGRYVGSKGKILKTLDNSELILKLLETGDEVKLRDDMVVKSGSVEEEKFLRKGKKSEDEYKGGRRDENGNRETRREESRKREARGDDNRNRDTRREDKKIKIIQESSISSSQSEAHKVRWLMSHIRVRVISKKFMGGKLYLKKGKVVDVVGPTTCDIFMDGSEELVQGVDQEILETALPKLGGLVIVLYGKHKGVFGNLVEKNSEKETAVVRDADSHDLVKVRLDEIAEYLGDPSYLGY